MESQWLDNGAMFDLASIYRFVLCQTLLYSMLVRLKWEKKCRQYTWPSGASYLI